MRFDDIDPPPAMPRLPEGYDPEADEDDLNPDDYPMAEYDGSLDMFKGIASALLLCLAILAVAAVGIAFTVTQ